MIKNIIFDIGNVIVRWDPENAVKAVLPEYEPKEFLKNIKPIWLDLNLGKYTEIEAIDLLHKQLDLSKEKLISLMHKFKTTQDPIAGTLGLLQNLKKQNYSLYSITDNIKEIIEYHKIHSNFLEYFEDIIVSAEIGVLKPDPRIFMHLIEKHKLIPSESIFIDDQLSNIAGAESIGIKGILFTDLKTCENELAELGVNL
jgi:putative hydrolase of the HAD superfamily